MAKKVYAVRKGLKTGIFNSWGECQQVIKGYSGAEFKGFNSEDEALSYLNGSDANARGLIDRPSDDNTVNIFTDGSFKSDVVAFGIYIQSKTKDIKLCGALNTNKYDSLRNIAGELFGVLSAVQVAKQLGYKVINIYYDYQGIEEWYRGTWRAKGELQQKYVSLLNNLRVSNDLVLNFHWVKGHSGNVGNITADKLALRAINLNLYVDDEVIQRGICTIDDLHISPL